MINICIYNSKSNIGVLVNNTLSGYKDSKENKFIKDIKCYEDLKEKNYKNFDVILAIINSSDELENVKNIFIDQYMKVIILTKNVECEYIISCIDVTSNICYVRTSFDKNINKIENIKKILRKIYLVGGGISENNEE